MHIVPSYLLYGTGANLVAICNGIVDKLVAKKWLKALY
ncbi:hypothetical protein HPSD74_1814 [Glaesserella parasuis D74]|nr:hypothetical protein HPSD74_1814 [Glaesserella parasuis D74]